MCILVLKNYLKLHLNFVFIQVCKAVLSVLTILTCPVRNRTNNNHVCMYVGMVTQRKKVKSDSRSLEQEIRLLRIQPLGLLCNHSTFLLVIWVNFLLQKQTTATLKLKHISLLCLLYVYWHFFVRIRCILLLYCTHCPVTRLVTVKCNIYEWRMYFFNI